MKVITKRGLSPVVATALLISITLVLAVVIFFWARSFIGESIEKEGSAIEMSCEEVDFMIEVRNGELYVTNIGIIPIYAFLIRVEGPGEINDIGNSGDTVGPGQSRTYSLPEGTNIGDTIRATPILLGETEEEEISYVCDPEDYYAETKYV